MRRHRMSLLLAVPFSLTLVVSACIGTTDADTPPPSAGAKGNSTDGLTYHERLVRYTQCMRDNGVKMDDPVLDANDEGGVTIRDDANADPAKLKAAGAKCTPLLGGGDAESDQADPADIEALRKWAKCLRENGLSDYPDPGPDGSFGQKALDPNDPAAGAAMAACEKLRNNPGSGR